MYITIYLIEEKLIIAGRLLERRLKKVSGFGGRESNPVLSHTSWALPPTVLRSLMLVARQIFRGSNPRRSLNFSQASSLRLQLSCKDHLCSIFIRMSNENFYKFTSCLSLIP